MARCIEVPKKDGERVRTELISAGILDLDSKIISKGDFLLIPILCESFGDYDAIDTDLPIQEHRITDYKKIVSIPPEFAGELPNSYDVVGDVAIIKLTDNLLPYKHNIGEALMDVASNIRTVMLDSGVRGEFRVRDLEQIAGSGSSETIHKEFGARMLVDPSRIYFNPRLATERARIAAEVEDGEIIIDMFAGVAPFGTVICRAAKPETVYSIDLNPEAEYFMRKNAEMNHITNIVPITGDSRQMIKNLPEADRVIMNLPQSADEFLNDALKKTKIGGTVHLYKIIERSDLDGFAEKIASEAAMCGLPMHIAKISELKTYSPTMSVYALDIIRD